MKLSESLSSCVLILITISNITPIAYSSTVTLSENHNSIESKFKNNALLENNNNNINIVSSHLRYNQISENSRRRNLSWWLLFWNALHPHLPCPNHCPDSGRCPPHCTGSDDDDSGGSSSSSSGGDDDDSNGDDGGSGGSSSSYYSNGDDFYGGGGYDDGSGGSGGSGYYNGGGNNSNSAESSAEEATVSSMDAKSGYVALLCAGVAAAGAILAVALGQRKGESNKPHPLQGSLGRRMMLFSGLANKNILSSSTSNRPERVVEIADNNDDSNVDYVRC